MTGALLPIRPSYNLRTVFLAASACLVMNLSGCSKPPPKEQASPEPRPVPPVFSMGQPNAKVRIDAFYPLDKEHAWVLDWLHEAGRNYGEKVNIRAYDIGTEPGRREWHRRGMLCGGLLVNDKSCFTVGGRKITLLRDPNTAGWTREHFVTVLASEVHRAYGQTKELLDTKSPVTSAQGPAPNRQAKAGGKSLFMFCGAGLRKPIEALRKAFEAEYGIPVRVCYAGSACLLAQIEITRRGDLYLPGEKFYIHQATERGYVAASKTVCHFIPVIMVRNGNPKGIHSLADLAQPGIRVGLGEAKSCAVGKTTAELLRKHKLEKSVGKNVVVYMGTAPELGNALKLGSIDAAINWDAVAAWYEDACDVVTLPRKRNVIVECPLGVLTFSKANRMSMEFLNFAAGEKGRQLFRKENYTVDLSRPIYPE